MSRSERRITRADVLPMAEYGNIRRERRAALTELKRFRRLSVGPFATLYFENYDTMWMQVHEMLYIERGGEEQIEGELDAYNPLIPQGRELIATMMLEIDNPERRARELGQLGGIDRSISLRIGASAATAEPIGEEDRTRDDGKTSSVHFLRFPLTPAQAAAFKSPEVEAVFVIAHPNYGHMAMVPPEVRRALIGDVA
ncbi:MAG: DUF3501 family protein [Alphaproteobacteria bacterium]|nr:DUF3501 family protein [Alphaproteobacteria bacterium]